MTSTPSPLWPADALLRATGGRMAAPFDATGVSIDTRTLRPGDLFIALIGENGDGHDHVATALEKGAAGALVHRQPAGLSDERLLVVEDTLVGLTRLGAFARARFGGRLIAVTGSVGKTTTKEMLRTILSAQGETHAAEASYNNHWGVPLTLARLPPGARFCVVEIGMNHAGEIAPLSLLARPHVALITTVAAAHIGHLGSIEAIADEKSNIMKGLEPGGVTVLPLETPQFARLRANAGDSRVATFGGQDGADAQLLATTLDANGIDITASVGGYMLRFRLGAPGRHMAMNAVAALAGAAALGANPTASARALESFAPMAGRGSRRVIRVPGGRALLLDESYNASSASVRAALAVLRLQQASRRVAVLGDMLELGAAGRGEHADLAPDIIGTADQLFTCGTLMEHLFRAIPEAIRGAHAADAAALAPLVAAAIRPGDAILVKGSYGSRMRTVVGALDRLNDQTDSGQTESELP